jgi:hypothetical protein
MFFLLFLLDDRRSQIRISDKWIRIQETQKHTTLRIQICNTVFYKEENSWIWLRILL